MDISSDPGCCWTTDLDKALVSSLIPDPYSCTGYSDWPDSLSGETLRKQHGHRWWPKHIPLTLTLMVSETMDINTDLGCYRAMDPDIALRSNPGPDDTRTPVAAQTS